MIRPPASNRLLNAIYGALVQHPEADGIRISIEPTAQECPNDDGTTRVMKSLCWNLKAGEKELTEPKLAVVHAELSEETIRADLAQYFPRCNSIVDNDITVRDD